jgi:CHAT domain-containing protein
MHLRAMWVQTVAVTRPVFSCVCFFLLVCGLLSAQNNSQTAFDAIALQLDQGDYARALEPAKQAWQHSNPGTEWRWQLQLQYAQVLLFNQLTAQADSLLKDPPAAYARLLPRYQYLKAYIVFRTGDPLAAERLARQAIAGARALHDALTEAETLLLLAQKLKDPARARRAAQQAYDLAHVHGLGVKEAAALLDLGLEALQNNRYAEAIPYFQQAAPIADRLHAHYVHVLSLSDLGECYYSLGDFDRAFRVLQSARPLLRASDPDSLKFFVDFELGSLYLQRRQLSQAIALFRRAVAVSSPERSIDDYVMVTADLADTLIQQGAFGEAATYNEKAQAALRRTPHPDEDLQAAVDLNRGDIAAARGALQMAFNSYQSVIQSQNGKLAGSLQWSAFAKLASVQEQMGQWAAAKKSFEHALASIETSRSAQKKAEYQITYLSSLIRFYQQYVDLLIKQHEEQTALAVADSSRASVLTQGSVSSRQLPNFSLRLRQLARSSNSVILFYWLAEKASYLWAVMPSGSRLLTLPSEAEISRDVASYSGFIQSERQDTLASANGVGKRLYRSLLGQLDGCFPAGSRVIIVPDGALHNLNFETLLVDAPQPHYWIHDVTVTVAPSLGILLARDTAAKPSGKQALLLGNPIYAGTEFPALPQSAVEIESVRKHFAGAATVITQRDAVAAAYPRSHPGHFGTIHFSAHVEADPQSPLDSAIILSAAETGNRLYARDVARIPLNANLVTVSGCWGAGARALSGEGLVGFAWASLQAGAHNAVTSLWAVDDRSTADLMDGFYAGVVAGKPYPAALRDAKLAMLQSAYRKPYYWAPFQIYSRSVVSDGRAETYQARVESK